MQKTSLLLSLLLPLVALSCNPVVNGDDAGNAQGIAVGSADWQPVGGSAGHLSKGDVTLDFPAGTFGDTDKVAITDVPAGSVAGEDEKSPFYQFTMPAGGSAKPLTVAIHYAGDPSEVKAVFSTEYYAMSLGKTLIHSREIESVAENGTISVTIPQLYPNEGVSPYFSVGLVTAGDASKSAVTRADADYDIKWNLWSYDEYRYRKYRDKMDAFLDEWIPVARSLLTNLKFEVPYVTYEIKELGSAKNKKDMVWGYFLSPSFFKTSGLVVINAAGLYLAVQDKDAEQDAEEERCTYVHETLHASHTINYDPRWAATANMVSKKGSEWTMLSEALAVWSELFLRDKKIISETVAGDPENYQPFIKSFYPKGYDSGLVTHSTYTNHGYAMSAFIHYLAKKANNNKGLVYMLMLQKKGRGSVRGVFEEYVKGDHLAFFTPEGYLDFARMYCNGDLVEGVNYQNINLAKACTSSNPVSVPYEKTSPEVDNFGFVVGTLRFPSGLMNDYSDYNLRFVQSTEGLESHIYYIDAKEQMVHVGKATYDEPFIYPIADFLKQSPNLIIPTITIKSTMGTGSSPLSSSLMVNFQAAPKMPNIWSIGFDGDVVVKKNTYWLNMGWTQGSSGTTISVSQAAGGYKVEAYDPHPAYQNTIRFTIKADKDGFGDAVDVYHKGASYDGLSFTLDKMSLKYFDSGKDASYGNASWKYTDAAGNTMNLEIYFDPL